MGKITWYLNRLKSMSTIEILWRIHNKFKYIVESYKFKKNSCRVIDNPYNLKKLKIDTACFKFNYNNKEYSMNTSISLLAGFDYSIYKSDWNAGFNTLNKWPSIFSYELAYKQNEKIGDARINWELNRHYQFPILAKLYYKTNNKKYLNELTELFYDWNNQNKFLHGISWTSPMEVSIRINSWIYTLIFLMKCQATKEIVQDILMGITNMTHYVANHLSKYSSANNHLIIELYSITMINILTHDKKNLHKNINILTDELKKQNFSDGVNKEQSLHYQGFVMEAYGLLMIQMKHNSIPIPNFWYEQLHKMTIYLKNCEISDSLFLVFGDDDEGKIADLQGTRKNYYKYILELMSMVLRDMYTNSINDETLKWFYSNNELDTVCFATSRLKLDSKTFEQGGVSIFRGNNIVVGVDHGPLGFGKIAAHGHADALSFQMFVDNKPIFIDAGTYIYHIKRKQRDYFRSTMNHNTLTVNNKNQSELLGPFLWGKKAYTTILKTEKNFDEDVLIASHDGYKPNIHTRTFKFNKIDTLTIIDQLRDLEKYSINFTLHPNVRIKYILEKAICVGIDNIDIDIKFISANKFRIIDKNISLAYGEIKKTKAIEIVGYEPSNITIININRNEVN